MNIGDRVRVVSTPNRYKEHSVVYKLGTIKTGTYNFNRKFGVELDGMRNPRSVYGHFYFESRELEVVYDNIDILEENIMENITDYLNIAKIRFIDGNNSSTYDYANFDPELKEGDLCVVKSAHHGFGVAKVESIVDRNDIQTQREIVAKVDTTAFDTRVANRAKAAELKAKMKARAKQLQDIALYQMLAKDDPDMMALLNEYQSISKT